MDSIYLQGSEQIQSAAHKITRAADTMSMMPSNLESVLNRFMYELDMRIYRIQELLEKKNGNG